MKYKVIITTSGIGSRMGDVTRFLNKALIRVGKRASISYILDNIPVEVPIVVTLGYNKEQVKEYLLFAHPERSFEFVEVTPFQGEGSSLGYSMLCAAPHLQCPFVFVACDTLFSLPISCPETNWMGVAKMPSAEQYTSVRIGFRGNIQEILSKGALDYDAVYVGLAGVSDYTAFWQSLSSLYRENPSDQSLNDTRVFAEMIRSGLHVFPQKIDNWLDIGNPEALQNARKQVPDYFDNLDKLDESIYLFDNQYVIKFFHDASIVQRRVERTRYLGSLVPQVQKIGKNFYRYEYISGTLFSSIVNPENLDLLLSDCQERLWVPVHLSEKEQEQFQERCKNFYHTKSLHRLNSFYQHTHILDQAYIVNGQKIPPLRELFECIDWDSITTGRPSGFHGDLHFENILFDGSKFYFLDWRQDFDGLTRYGDTYYDLAKLNHGMIVSHDIVRKNLFDINIQGNRVTCEILRPDNLVLCQEKFASFALEAGFDAMKIDVLTALIFLNIAPLHHHPYNLFLHFFGRLRLWHALYRTTIHKSAKKSTSYSYVS